MLSDIQLSTENRLRLSLRLSIAINVILIAIPVFNAYGHGPWRPEDTFVALNTGAGWATSTSDTLAGEIARIPTPSDEQSCSSATTKLKSLVGVDAQWPYLTTMRGHWSAAHHTCFIQVTDSDASDVVDVGVLDLTTSNSVAFEFINPKTHNIMVCSVDFPPRKERVAPYGNVIATFVPSGLGTNSPACTSRQQDFNAYVETLMSS